MKDAFRGAVYVKISPQEVKRMINGDKEVIILDVRSTEEYKAGHIKNAISLPLNNLNVLSKQIITDSNKVIIVYCKSGIKSKAAAKELINLGYSYVYDMGGISNWPYEIVK